MEGVCGGGKGGEQETKEAEGGRERGREGNCCVRSWDGYGGKTRTLSLSVSVSPIIN